MTPVPPLLIDSRNFASLRASLLAQLQAAPHIGLDVETEDSSRHDGLNKFSGYDGEGQRSAGKKLAIDMRRSRLCGLSLYAPGMANALYFNVGHADIENRLTSKQLRAFLVEAKAPSAQWLCHNAPFELTILANTLQWFMPEGEVVCTMQMAVSAFGPDEYDRNEFRSLRTGELFTLMDRIAATTDETELDDLISKVTGKASNAAHSYNGFIAQIAFGYGLKQLVKRFFNYEMTTYEQVLGQRAHMGQLTGEEVASYGADDAFWVVPLYDRLLSWMYTNGGEHLIRTFFEQENPMIHIFSAIQRGGMRVDHGAIADRRALERENAAETLREMKAAVNELLPFDKDLHAGLLRYENWYAKNGHKYRQNLCEWAASPDHTDAFNQVAQVRSPVTSAWCEELGVAQGDGPNLSHYMPVRVLLYDLIGAELIFDQGKVQSDGETRGKLRDQLEGPARTVVECLTELAAIDQRCKLFINPYSLLTDPDTKRLYPSVSSMLATRRMGCTTPNAMQLAKRGESAYIRGFYLPDYDDHVLLSLDWSAIELVLIGELSQDPEFLKAFGQLPHDDLHSGAAADILAVEVPELTEASFLGMKQSPKWEFYAEKYGITQNLTRLQTNLKGEFISDPTKAQKYWRTEIGKGANFSYWYSGWLHDVGQRMGWDQDTVKAAVERYTNRFYTAEQWRLDTIKSGQLNGFVTLPDGHRRTRYEATPDWFVEFCGKFVLPHDHSAFGQTTQKIASKIQKRSFNQIVNAMIQGSSATLTKRSILRIEAWIKDQGWTNRECRFLMPVHDELLFSVHRDLVPEATNGIRHIMITHPDLFQHCVLDSTPSVGTTFEPYHPVSAPLGQVELYELPAGYAAADRVGQRANDDEIMGVVDRLFSERQLLRAA
jgi:DNA polymerase I-like protein with 3'-5' exonuclease and polymerase domains